MARVLCGVVVVLVLGPTAPVRADEAEEKAVKFVEEREGLVERDRSQPGNPVVGVNWISTKVTDADLKELDGLKNLTSLSLFGTKEVTAAGLKELAALPKLTSVRLGLMTVTDAGMKELAGLKGLTKVSLVSAQVTDTGVKELVANKGITELSLP